MTLLLHDIRRKEQRDDVKKENEDGYNNEMGRLEHKSPSYTPHKRALVKENIGPDLKKIIIRKE